MERSELDTVLDLRRAFFADKTVSPDASYIECWNKNDQAFKVIYDRKEKRIEPVGYWGLIPIDDFAYQSFLKGRTSHEDMLSEETLDWCDIDPGNVYLYVIGAVNPDMATAVSESERQIAHLMSGWMLVDLFDFAEVLLPFITCRGICGYPSKTGGANIISKLKFKQNGTYIDGDENQPVSYVSEDGINMLRERTKRLSGRFGHHVWWEGDDKERFLTEMKRCIEQEGEA